MTADERLELLLNRANQTLSELKRNHTARERVPALEAVKAYRGLKPKEIACEWDYEEYILHLTDVIDVMETAMENTLGTLDWLRIKCCDICGLRPEYGEEVCETCDVNRGVPTNWKPGSESTWANWKIGGDWR